MANGPATGAQARSRHMWRIYTSIAVEHEFRQVAFAVALGFLGSITTGILLQRGIASRRTSWLVMAGVICGVSIWSAHFTAMLGFMPELNIQVDLPSAVNALAASILLSTSGWLVAFAGARSYGLIGGCIAGAGIAAAHFLDMSALRFGGDFLHDTPLILLALALGVGLSGLAGWFMQRSPVSPLALPTAAALALAILGLHFVAMAALTVVPSDVVIPEGTTLEPDSLTSIILLAATLIIGSGLGVVYRNDRVAQATAADRARLAEAIDALRRSEDHHRASIELNPQIPWLGDAAGSIIEIAPRWGELVGLPSEAGLGDGWRSVVHPDDLPGVLAMWTETIAAGASATADGRYRIRQADGAYRWFRERARPRCDQDGSVIAWYGVLDDIDDQVKAELALRESEERYRLASGASNDIIWDWSAATNRIEWSGALETVFGCEHAGPSTSWDWWCDSIHPDDRQRVVQGIKRAMKGSSNPWIAEYRFRMPNGGYLHAFSRAQLIRDEAGWVTRAVGSMVDLTERKAVEENLSWGAHHDPLTLLPNRLLYAERLEEAIARAGDTGQLIGLILIDLTKFKILNDSLGHAAGDAVLREVARRLRSCVGPEATVARLGGDEFALVLPALHAEGALLEAGRRILSGFLDPVKVEDEKVQISLGIGTALWPRDALRPQDLRKCADLALYAAKADHPGSIRAFEPALLLAMEQRLAMLEKARCALAEHRIQPYYQPKINLRTGRRVGVEALLRWTDAQGEVRLPAEIAAALDDAELAPKITSRMLDRILLDCQYWQSRGVTVGKVAFNVSGSDFARGDFAERFLARLAEAGLPPTRFEIEITESVFLGQLAGRVGAALITLRAAGVTVALDDFGTGYASLTHIHEFPVDVMKIDRSFVSRLPQADTASAVIVDAVLQMARGLGITTVAEGIETKEQESYLRSKGCDLGQGYLYGRAAAPKDEGSTGWPQAEVVFG